MASRPSRVGWPLVFRAGSRRDDPVGISYAASFSGRTARRGARRQDRQLPPPHSGRARGVAALSRRTAGHQCQRKSLFRAQVDRRRHRCAAHGARAHSDSGAWRRCALQRVHPQHAGLVAAGPVDCGAGDAGRDHAAAALVSIPPRQGQLLGARDACAFADHPDGAAGAARWFGAFDRRTFRHAARRREGVAQGRASERAVDGDLRRSGSHLARCGALFSEALCAHAPSGPPNNT